MKLFTDFVQEAAFLIGEIDEEAGLDWTTDVTVGFYTLKVKHDAEKVEVKSLKNEGYDLPVPFWKSDFEKVFLAILKVREKEIQIEQAENNRLEYEEKCRRFENINYAGTIPGY